jgi:hypothetical protein
MWGEWQRYNFGPDEDHGDLLGYTKAGALRMHCKDVPDATLPRDLTA